jgi:hypothetical protein
MQAVVMICLLRHNFIKEDVMKRICFFIMILILFFLPTLSWAVSPTTLMPNRSGRFDNQRNNSNLTPHYFGIDSQGNTSVLTPNHSGGYIGFDSQGNGVMITPLRGNLGVDNYGNIWTIRSR